MALRLQYKLREIELPIGELVIGRSMDCQLPLDDALASRRHARIVVRAEGAVLEDLGSRNGLFLNGVRVDRLEPLHDGDVIRIGSQDLTFRAGEIESSPRSSRQTMLEPLPAVPRLYEDEPDDVVSEATNIITVPTSASDRLGAGLALIGGVAEKALAMGRVAEAERLLQRSLADILAHAARGEVDLDLCERASGYATRLAAATGHGSWVDYVFRLYTLIPALVPARLVDELYTVVRKVKQTDKSVLRAYTARIRGIAGNFGPAERFVQQRIEGFERWAP